MNNNPLIGSWRLVSFELQLTDGTLKYPWGKELVGLVTYTADGYMSGTFMKPNRANFVAPDMMGGTAEETDLAMKSYVGYAGAYSVREDRVIHHVSVSWFPNWSGTDIERSFEVENDLLTLRTPSLLMGGVQAVSVGIWQKLSARTTVAPR